MCILHVMCEFKYPVHTHSTSPRILFRPPVVRYGCFLKEFVTFIIFMYLTFPGLELGANKWA